MKYTFHSTEFPVNFNEIYCPIIYPGVCKRLRRYVNELTSIHNINELVSKNIIFLFDKQETSNAFIIAEKE